MSIPSGPELAKSAGLLFEIPMVHFMQTEFLHRLIHCPH
jgi:hypothetical protein